MLPSSPKDVLIRRSVEALAVIAIALVLVYVFTGMGTSVTGVTTFGIWKTIAIVEVAAFFILCLAYVELTQDPRLHRRERLFVPPLLAVAFSGSLVLGMIWFAAWLAVQASGIHLFDATILFAAMFFCVDVSLLGVVTSLFLAVRRLHRSERSHPDAVRAAK